MPFAILFTEANSTGPLYCEEDKKGVAYGERARGPFRLSAHRAAVANAIESAFLRASNEKG